ncbi:hypothetical protein [Sinorhizobium meliloti]|uniref:hypothetical protein n=1 Tax=Rhizobium meliloti TaxID=382 RepID=UPI001F2FE396|nr:hypothetical protein [Sinorhizobium meliloti]
MLGLLIEDVTLLVDDEVNIHIRWRGGRTQSLSVARPRPMSVIRKTPAQVVAFINELLETANDRQIAARLNELGHRNWRGEPFTLKPSSSACALRPFTNSGGRAFSSAIATPPTIDTCTNRRATSDSKKAPAVDMVAVNPDLIVAQRLQQGAS